MQRCDSFQGRSGQVIGSQCNNEATHKVSAKSRFKTLSLCKQCASAYQRYPKEFTVIKINKD